MKKLPTGIQSIKKILLNRDYVYVDKTGFAKQLIEEGSPHYFISRPRRFGKSLFLSTLGEILKGNKELFNGLQIYESNYSWEEYPVVYIDFSKIANRRPEKLELAIKTRLEIIARENNISIITNDIEVALDTLIVRLSEKKNSPVVLLIDEYDQPIINNLKNLEVAEQNRDLLKDFFGTIKSLDEYLKLTFVTGVSKFSQVSLFSGPNNLTDITMDPRYADLMGYTEEDLKHYFHEHIQSITKPKNSLNKKPLEGEILEEIRHWYNGYRFSERDISIYNPYSTLLFLRAKKAESYWYSTGTPSFLIDQVKKHPQAVIPLSGTTALKSTLSDISKLDRIHLPALMFQTGYLTIKNYNPEENSYRLDFPNQEVRQAFFNSLLQEFTEINPLDVDRTSLQIRRDLENYDLESFFSKINVHFAKIAYQIFLGANEGFYQAVFFTLLEKSGIKTSSEVATNIGRIDLISETPKAIYIFELKLDKTADIAFIQTEAKNYRERYLHDGKDILVIGVNFSSKTHNVGDWKVEVLSSSGKI